MKPFFTICLFLTCFVPAAFPHTWIAAHAGMSVREAIAAAREGDTVIVKGGTYREGNIVINKRICLLGEGKPVLDGEKKYEIISIKANGVTVKGFVLQHSGASSLADIAAVKLYGCRDVVLTDNLLIDNFFGIYLQVSKRCLIKNNIVRARQGSEFESGDGIHCWKSDGLVIEGNEFSGHRDGIYFEFVTNSVIRSNNSHNNVRYGLHFMFSHNDTYLDNQFRRNGTGVSVMYSHGVKMLYNSFAENWGDAAYAILMKDIDDSQVIANSFLKNTVGIYMEGTNRVIVQKNLFSFNGWALKVQASCNGNEVKGNNFIGNSFDVGTNGSLVLNRFDYNYWDKYEGYDLDRNGIGDLPYRPVSMYSVVVEKNPVTMMLFRSFMVTLMDKAEKVIPSITPENLKDEHPAMKPFRWKGLGAGVGD